MRSWVIQQEGHSRVHCSLAYSALACFRMGMMGSASFQRVRRERTAGSVCLLWQLHFAHQLGEAWIRTQGIK